MTTIAYIVMTPEQKDQAVMLDDANAELGPRIVDNELANNLGYGQLFGMWLAPARLLVDPTYLRWVPTLGAYPIHVFDTDTVFLPQPMDI